MGGAEGEAKQGAESEGQSVPAETESEEHENKEEPNAEPGESSEAAEGDLPADMVRYNVTTYITSLYLGLFHPLCPLKVSHFLLFLLRLIFVVHIVWLRKP